MAFDYKKEYKEFYMPKNKPNIVEIPKMNYLAVRGKGNPNDENSEYKKSIGLLYGIAFTIKMSPRNNYQMAGYFEYVVPPLEGFWWQDGVKGMDYNRKKDLNFISLIRLPDFVTINDFNWAIKEATKKKKQDFSKVEFLSYDEGICVQSMHLGSYDDEPKTVEEMHNYAKENGYQIDISEERFHHEIYLSDPRKCDVNKLKTVIRHPIKLEKTHNMKNLEIEKIIKDNYQIKEITNIKKINRGTADIFLIETNTQKYIFKYYQNKYLEENINNEIKIINFLNDKIPTAKYIKTINDNYTVIHNNRVVVLMDFIDGIIKEKNCGELKEILESATYLGKIVKALEDYPHNNDFNQDGWLKLDCDKLIYGYQELLKKLAKNDQYYQVIKNDINKKITILKKLNSFEVNDIFKISIKFTHGDYSVMQFIYDNDEIKAIIDFAAASDMPIAWEIIRSYTYIDKSCKDGKINIENLILYVKEFINMLN